MYLHTSVHNTPKSRNQISNIKWQTNPDNIVSYNELLLSHLDNPFNPFVKNNRISKIKPNISYLSTLRIFVLKCNCFIKRILYCCICSRLRTMNSFFLLWKGYKNNMGFRKRCRDTSMTSSMLSGPMSQTLLRIICVCVQSVPLIVSTSQLSKSNKWLWESQDFQICVEWHTQI